MKKWIKRYRYRPDHQVYWLTFKVDEMRRTRYTSFWTYQQAKVHFESDTMLNGHFELDKAYWEKL